MAITRDAQTMTSAQLREFSGEHLYYELHMFFACGEVLARPMELGFKKNLAMEGYVMHLRALIEFFTKRETNSLNDKDDVYAVDFAPSWQAPSLSDDAKLARTRANKEVGHITSYRKNKNDKAKDWSALIASVTPEVRKWCEQFVREADTDKLNPNVELLLKNAKTPTMAKITVGGNSTTTMSVGSTTATIIKTNLF